MTRQSSSGRSLWCFILMSLEWRRKGFQRHLHQREPDSREKKTCKSAEMKVTHFCLFLCCCVMMENQRSASYRHKEILEHFSVKDNTGLHPGPDSGGFDSDLRGIQTGKMVCSGPSSPARACDYILPKLLTYLLPDLPFLISGWCLNLMLWPAWTFCVLDLGLVQRCLSLSSSSLPGSPWRTVGPLKHILIVEVN